MHPRSYTSLTAEDRQAIRHWWRWVIATYAVLTVVVLVFVSVTRSSPSPTVAQGASVNVVRAGN
jgi:hypothetical protein